MSNVTALDHRVDKSHIVRLFSRFKSQYLNVWEAIAKTPEEWNLIMDDWFDELSKFSLNDLYKAVKEALAIYRTYPPKLGELVDLCLKASGVPSASECLKMAIDRQFDHPMAKLVYDKIGSWKLANATEKEMQSLSAVAYSEAIAAFTDDPKHEWKMLNDYTAEKLATLPPPEKIPTASEMSTGKALFDEALRKLKEGQALNANTFVPECDEEKISPTNRNFDQAIYDKFCDFLLGIPETEVMSLSPQYALRRMRLLAAKEQPSFLKQAGYNPNPQGTGKTQESPQNRRNKPYRVFSD